MRYSITAANGTFTSNDHFLDAQEPFVEYTREEQFDDEYVSVIDTMFTTEVSDEVRKLGAVDNTTDGTEVSTTIWALPDRIAYAYNETLTDALAFRTLNVWGDGNFRVGSVAIARLTGLIDGYAARCVKCSAMITLTADSFYGNDLGYDREMMQDLTANIIRHGNNHSSAYAGTGANRRKVQKTLIG
jgi:hypothetical protein